MAFVDELDIDASAGKGGDGVVRWQLDAMPGAGFGQVTPLGAAPWGSE